MPNMTAESLDSSCGIAVVDVDKSKQESCSRDICSRSEEYRNEQVKVGKSFSSLLETAPAEYDTGEKDVNEPVIENCSKNDGSYSPTQYVYKYEKYDKSASDNLRIETKPPVEDIAMIRENKDEDSEEEEWRLREACGVFAAAVTSSWPSGDCLATTVCMGLSAIQHRGQESAGMVTSDGSGEFRRQRGAGLVSAVFDEVALARLGGRLALGHTRYSTMGGADDAAGLQPFVVHTRHGQMALAHNGQLVNAAGLRAQVLKHGVGLSSGSDSELLVQMLALEPPCGEPHGADWPARLRHVMSRTPTAYSLGVLFGSAVYGARDPYGNRPLSIGYLPSVPTSGHSMSNGTLRDRLATPPALAYLLASETCAIQSVGGVWIRDVEPGEIVQLSAEGIRSLDVIGRPDRGAPPALCIFEYVYFARADSWLENQMVYTVRERCGEQLALEAPATADVVSTVPESATPAAIGFARQSRLPYVEVFTKNRYVGRTFIQPSQRDRHTSVLKKFGVLAANVSGRRVIIVDDSIVRGTTIGPIVRLLRQNGAKEVHIRVASPPILHPCYMGINIPNRGELFANKHAPGDTRTNATGADTLRYLSVAGLQQAVRGTTEPGSNPSGGHCVACLNGQYPVSLEW